MASACPIGAAIKAPSDPAADTMPSTALRAATGTGRDADAMAMALPLAASAAPMQMPAPSITAVSPPAVASSTSPTMYNKAPPTISRRMPMRTAHAPAMGCKNPQARFCTAMAKVKSATGMPRSRVTAGMKMPRLCRSPMEIVSISEAPIKMGREGRRAWKVDMAYGSGLGRVASIMRGTGAVGLRAGGLDLTSRRRSVESTHKRSASAISGIICPCNQSISPALVSQSRNSSVKWSSERIYISM